MEKIYFAKLNESAVLPNKRKEDAGYDLYACFDDDITVLAPFENKLIPTGIAWAASDKFYLQIEERSSTGSKGIKRNAGIVDSGYRGEIKVSIFNATGKTLVFSNLSEEEFKNKYPKLAKENYHFHSTQKAIAQGIVHKVYNLKTQELSYDELCKIESSRGKGGFGSTNKKD